MVRGPQPSPPPAQRKTTKGDGCMLVVSKRLPGAHCQSRNPGTIALHVGMSFRERPAPFHRDRLLSVNIEAVLR